VDWVGRKSSKLGKFRVVWLNVEWYWGVGRYGPPYIFIWHW